VTRGLLDTSVFIARESRRRLDAGSFPDEVAVSAITIGELRAGVLAAGDVRVRDRRLATLTHALALQPVPIDEPVAEAWATLRVLLHEGGRRMPVNDSWIAATAIALGVSVVTQDDDYDDIPGLQITKV
jgi:predicted nucleic acid-binding protein